MRPSPRWFFVHLLQVWVDSQVKYIKIHENPRWLQTSINTVNLDTIGTIWRKWQSWNCNFSTYLEVGGPLQQIGWNRNWAKSCVGFHRRYLKSHRTVCIFYMQKIHFTARDSPYSACWQANSASFMDHWITVWTNNNCIQLQHIQTWPRW